MNKDIDEMLKDILNKEEQTSNLFNDDNFVLFLIFMLITSNNNYKDQPIINIYLGDD